MADDYGGLFGGFLFALRRSDSYAFRAYVVASALVGLFAALLLALGVVTWLATPAPIGQRALLGVIAILVLVPLFAPVLVVARRHRRGASSRRADGALGLAGFGFVLAVYLAGVISAPDLPETSGALAPVVAALDAVPRRYWVVPPLLSVASIWLVARLTQPARDPGGGDPPDDDGERAEG